MNARISQQQATSVLPAALRDYYEDNYAPHLPADRTARILDLGCGDGGLLLFLSAAGFKNVLGVDSDASELAKIPPLAGVNTTQAAVSAQYLSGRPEAYDLIIMKQMIYYFSRDHVFEIMHAARMALAANGVLIVEVFNGCLLSSRFTEMKDPGIKTAYTEHSLRRLLTWSGFEITHLFGQTSRGRSFKGKLYRLARTIWMRTFRLILILERGYDDELPTIFQRSIIAVATKSSRPSIIFRGRDDG